MELELFNYSVYSLLVQVYEFYCPHTMTPL